MRSRLAVCAAALALLFLAACGAKPAHDYPAAAEAAFHRQCPASEPVCVCTWEHITRDLTAEEYQAALDRFQKEGLMDPRVTHARALCREKHPN
jgi:predicted small lipoprotein YifL